MIEVLKHLFGICGEPHINIFTILMTTPILSYIIVDQWADSIKHICHRE